MRETKLILTALAAALLLTIAASAANARNLRVSEKNFEAIWDNALTGKTRLTFRAASGSPISCKLTLLGSFTESTIAKVLNSTVGRIRHATSGTCAEGTLTFLQETLPWNLTYQGFTGRLPAIEKIRLGLIGIAFKLREPGGVECLAGTSTRNPISVEIEGLEPSGGAENIRANEEVTIPLGGGFLCSLASPARFSGTGLLRNLPGTAKITITLI